MNTVTLETRWVTEPQSSGPLDELEHRKAASLALSQRLQTMVEATFLTGNSASDPAQVKYPQDTEITYEDLLKSYTEANRFSLVVSKRRQLARTGYQSGERWTSAVPSIYNMATIT